MSTPVNTASVKMSSRQLTGLPMVVQINVGPHTEGSPNQTVGCQTARPGTARWMGGQPCTGDPGQLDRHKQWDRLVQPDRCGTAR